MTPMDVQNTKMARQIAEAAAMFQKRVTGHAPGAVGVVISDDTLVIKIRGALTPAEQAMSKTPDGAARVREFHRQLFLNSVESLRSEIKRITGVEVREAAAEVESAQGPVVHTFTTGTMVQMFQLARRVSSETWTGNGRIEHHDEAISAAPTPPVKT